MDDIATNNRVRRLLKALPPLLDGFEAICIATAQGDRDRVWSVAVSSKKNATAAKQELQELSQALNRRGEQ